jgi:MoaA/NifB/PqqE/SkfB family radical SAM enzyme
MLVMTAPQFVNWNYTYRCNLNCQHCYSRAPSYPEELSTAQNLHIVDQLIEAQVFRVAFGGGEVLLRDDCVAMIARLSAGGVEPLLTTSGWFLDDRWAARLASAGLGELYVSLDSPHADQHDSFRNRHGSFARALRALHSAVGAGLTVYLSTVLTTMNLDDLQGLVEIAERHRLAGINFKRFRAAGNGLATKDRYQLGDEQGASIEREIARLRQWSGLDLSLNFGPEASDVDSGCACGTSAIALRPNGDVCPCVYSETVIGNLMRQSLADLWRNAPELLAMRAQGGCTALLDYRWPSNPSLRKGLVFLPVVEPV